MSDTMDVQYDEGSPAVSLADGTVAERGKPCTVSGEIGKQLVEQGWTEVKGGKPIDPTPPKPTDAAIELAEELGINVASVKGTGGQNKNQVTVDDVEEFAETQTATAEAGSQKDKE